MALIVGVAGVAGLGVGAGFAVAAKSAYNGSLSNCQPSAPDECTAAGVSQRNNALSLGTDATVLVIGGAVAAAAGVVLWVTAPSGRKAGQAGQPRHVTQTAGPFSLGVVPSVGVGGAGAIVRGSW